MVGSAHTPLYVVNFPCGLLPFRWVAILDCLASVAVNLTVLSFLRYLSALYLLFAAYVKDIITVLISVIYTDEGINATEIQGYILLLLGLATWRYLVYQEKKDEEEERTRGNDKGKGKPLKSFSQMNPQSPSTVVERGGEEASV